MIDAMMAFGWFLLCLGWASWRAIEEIRDMDQTTVDALERTLGGKRDPVRVVSLPMARVVRR